MHSIKIKDQAVNCQFYTSDISGNYVIYLEGITESEIPFTASTSFVVGE